MGSRSAVAFVVLVAAVATVHDARAQDSGGSAVDVEIRRRTAVAGTLDPPSERDTFRVRVPAGARLRADARTLRHGPPLVVTMTGPAGPLVPETTPLRGGTRHEVPDAPEGSVRIDVTGDGVRTGDFRLDVRWDVPRSVPFAGTTGAEPVVVPFAAEAGTRVRFRLAAPAARAGARFAGLDGPSGPVPIVAGRGSGPATAVVPVTGTYQLSIAADAPTEVSGRILLPAVRRAAKLDVTRRSRRVGNGRLVSRLVDAQGSNVEAPRLDEDQLVTVDVSGCAVDLPAGALSLPTMITVGPASEIAVPGDAASPAGVPVRFDSERQTLAEDATITLPYDAGAFVDGVEGLSVYTRDDDGTVRLVPGPYVIDEEAGTVTFPAPHFSAYGVFQPPVEMVVAARPFIPQGFAVGADGTVFVLGYDEISTFDPETGALALFAGDGTLSDEGTHRLSFSFRQTSGAGALPDGSLLVCDGGSGSDDEGNFADFPGIVWRIAPDGSVSRFAGDGTPFTADGSDPLATGLGWPQAVARGPSGDVFVLVSPVFGRTPDDDFSEGGSVLRIDAATGKIARVAGGGTVFEGDGQRPLDVRMVVPGSLLVDRAGRLLVGTAFEVYRFDLALDTTEVVAGAGILAEDELAVSGLGAPLRNVSFGRICGLAFDPATEDVVYASDDFAGIVWRLDLAHDRAHIAAGRRIRFEESIRFVSVSGRPAERLSTLRAPADAVRVGPSLFIAETFGHQIRELRPKQ